MSDSLAATTTTETSWSDVGDVYGTLPPAHGDTMPGAGADVDDTLDMPDAAQFWSAEPKRDVPIDDDDDIAYEPREIEGTYAEELTWPRPASPVDVPVETPVVAEATTTQESPAAAATPEPVVAEAAHIGDEAHHSVERKTYPTSPRRKEHLTSSSRLLPAPAAEEPVELTAEAATPVADAPSVEQPAPAEHEPVSFEAAAIIEEAAPLPVPEISVVEPVVVVAETRYEDERPFIVAERAIETPIAEAVIAEEPAAEETAVEEPIAEAPITEMAVGEQAIAEEPVVETPIVVAEESTIEEAPAEETTVFELTPAPELAAAIEEEEQEPAFADAAVTAGAPLFEHVAVSEEAPYAAEFDERAADSEPAPVAEAVAEFEPAPAAAAAPIVDEPAATEEPTDFEDDEVPAFEEAALYEPAPPFELPAPYEAAAVFEDEPSFEHEPELEDAPFEDATDLDEAAAEYPEAPPFIPPPAFETPAAPPPYVAAVPPRPMQQPGVVLPMARNPIRSDTPPPLVGSESYSGLARLLRIAAARGASTLYLSSDARPSVRLDSEMQAIEGEPILTAYDVESLLLTLMPERSHEALRTGAATEWISDIEDVGRVRCMSFRDQRGPGGVFRLMAGRAVSTEQLGLSREVQALAMEPEGLVLVAGPRSSGKRTIMSSLVDYINRTRRDHVITIEREINIVHDRGTSFISQREVRGGNDDMYAAARAALREDPDVLVIEEIKTGALMNVAIEAAASGHLVIGGFSAHNATQAVDRIIDLYAPEHRRQIQMAIADHLRGIIVQVLLRKNGGGRLAARELLLNTPAVASVIAEGKTSQLPMAIEGGRRHGMVPLNDALVGFVQGGTVDPREAYRKATDRAGLLAVLKRQGVDTSFVERFG